MKEKIDVYEIWDLKKSIAEFIEPRLRLYIEKMEGEETMSIPNWVENEKVNYQNKEIMEI